ncbi:nucleolar zinc-finger protein [Boothiomyces sp. JEL0838]|nr:nucleolar zinc-finger protein [Boothiomyces sp. JEL0838]
MTEPAEKKVKFSEEMEVDPNQGIKRTETLFENIDGEQAITEVESLCMGCGENGTTKLLLTKVPHFREIILMAFECPHCGLRNNEIQPAQTIAEKGIKQVVRIAGQKDLNRQVVKSESATVRFEELDFEIPPNSQSGILSTVDGMIDRAIEGLKQEQPARLLADYELYKKIEGVIEVLQEYYDNKTHFTFAIDDPTGNSYIENLCAPKEDPQIKTTLYTRTKEQNLQLGMQEQEEPLKEEEEFDLNEQEVIIMSTDCDACGYKSNEVKAGGAVAAKGRKISLLMTEMDDLSRDILKSESCGLTIPEIDLQLTTGTLGGRFTTVEGLLTQVYEELEGKAQFLAGDSAESESKSKFRDFLDRLQKVLKGEMFPVTLILYDPLANSHLQNPYAPDPDPNMTIEEFERSFEENENYGLNDMKPFEKPTDAEKLSVTFITPQKEKITVYAKPNTNLLDIAHGNNIDLEGACEGSLACSTCHLIIQPEFYEKLEEPSDEENDMLDLAFGLTETSRLGCQVTLTKELDGMTVTMPSATRNMQLKDN